MEEREQAFRETSVQSTVNFEKEIARLREQGSKIVEEEQRLLREKLSNYSQGIEEDDEEEFMRIKVSWEDGYNEESIRKIFSTVSFFKAKPIYHFYSAIHSMESFKRWFFRLVKRKRTR